MNLTKKLINKGYKLPKDYSQFSKLPNSTKQIYALFEMGDLPESSKRNYSLGDLTKAAIDHLNTDADGFILMVEGSQIDYAGHDHKSKELLDEMNDFSLAVKEALNFAKADGNTFVLVTSDHETGGMSITKGSKDAIDLELSYSTGGHTPSPVGIFAFGPGEEFLKEL